MVKAFLLTPSILKLTALAATVPAQLSQVSTKNHATSIQFINAVKYMQQNESMETAGAENRWCGESVTMCIAEVVDALIN